MNLRDTVKKILIHEISSKIVDKLVQKWTQGKDINPEKVKEYIDEFSDISSSLPVEFRDITKLDFSTVSKIVEARRAKNRLKKLTTKFKKMDYPEGAPKPSNLDLKRTIKKYICADMITPGEYTKRHHAGHLMSHIQMLGGRTISEETNELVIDHIHFGESGHRIQADLFYEHIIKYR